MNAPDQPALAARVEAAPVLLRTDEGGVARLTMNRPRQFNAISHDMLVALQAQLDAIAIDPSVRAVVIAGAGSAFSGGHDLKEMMANRTEAFVGDLFERCSRVMLTMQSLPQPVVARVLGISTAAGCQVVAACDLAVASSDARFATSGINFGLFCATPGVPVSRNVSQAGVRDAVHRRVHRCCDGP
jgi:enoyl-CoA hydratase/carnithine racemase